MKTALSFLLVLGASNELYATSDGGEFFIAKPTAHQLRTTLFGSAVDFEWGLWLPNPNIHEVPTEFTACITEISSEFDAGGDTKRCTESTRFTLHPMSTGTHMLQATIQAVGPDPSTPPPASKMVLLDVIDAAALQQDITQTSLAKQLPTIAPHIARWDYVYFRNNMSDVDLGMHAIKEQHSEQFLTLAAVDQSAAAFNNFQHRPISAAKRLKVGVFARIAPRFVPSDRFYDWLCDHSALVRRGIDLVIIAPAPDTNADAAETLCGVKVEYFHPLREAEAATLQKELDSPEGDLGWLKKRALSDLSLFLCGQLDALLVINTYGDAQSSVMLNIIHALHTTPQERLPAPFTMCTPPIVVMDLPNLVVPYKWRDRVDAYIAPSRAVGLHAETVALGKPVAVIYPPVRGLVIDSSLCTLQYWQQQDGATRGCIVPQADDRVNTTSVLPAGKFNVLFVGRLARVKCPGLLIRAVAQLMALAVAGPTEQAGSGSSGGQDEAEMTGTAEMFRPSALMAALIQQMRSDEVTVETGESTTISSSASVQYVLAQVTEFLSNVHITYVGGGREVLTAALQDLAADLGVAGLVSLEGQQPAPVVAQFMRQADVLVNPIVTGETFGLVHVEAAAQGLPVIAFDTRANAESVVTHSNNTSVSASPRSSGGCGCGAGVRSALLPFKEGQVLQDLAVALLTAYSQHKEQRICLSRMQDVPCTADAVDCAECSTQREPGRQRTEVCESVLPMFRHWNTRQHSEALADALFLFTETRQK